jgi:hypothetical protein
MRCFFCQKNKGSVLAPGEYHVGSWGAGTPGCPLLLSQWSGTEKGGKLKCYHISGVGLVFIRD